MALTRAEICRRFKRKHPEKYTAEARREGRVKSEKVYRDSKSYRVTQKKYRRSEKYYDAQLRSKYGITLKDKRRMYGDQAGLCLFCRKDLLFEKAYVDHSHKTGKVRGLVHAACNTRLGFVENNLRNCLDYLFKVGDIPASTVGSWRKLLDDCDW